MSSQTSMTPKHDSCSDKQGTTNRQRRSSSATRRGSQGHINSPTIPNALMADAHDNTGRFITGQGGTDKGRSLRPVAGPVMSMLTHPTTGSNNGTKNMKGTDPSGGNLNGSSKPGSKPDEDKGEVKKKRASSEKEYWDREVYSNAAGGN